MGLTSNLPEIIAKLEAAVLAAEQAGADLVAKRAADTVAYDLREPHHVRDAIHTKRTEDGVLVVAGDRDAFWAHMIEHGTSHSPPQPFLVPALEENREAIIELQVEAIRQVTG